MPILEMAIKRKQVSMLILDIFRREESRIDSVPADSELPGDEEVDDRKIIHFASAKAELKQYASAHYARSQSIDAFLKSSRAERTTVMAESAFAIILILAVLVSTLLEIIYGF
jgi:hypothetical protein